jgi:hypothetical protein
LVPGNAAEVLKGYMYAEQLMRKLGLFCVLRFGTLDNMACDA